MPLPASLRGRQQFDWGERWANVSILAQPETHARIVAFVRALRAHYGGAEARNILYLATVQQDDRDGEAILAALKRVHPDDDPDPDGPPHVERVEPPDADAALTCADWLADPTAELFPTVELDEPDQEPAPDQPAPLTPADLDIFGPDTKENPEGR